MSGEKSKFFSCLFDHRGGSDLYFRVIFGHESHLHSYSREHSALPHYCCQCLALVHNFLASEWSVLNVLTCADFAMTCLLKTLVNKELCDGFG